MTNIALRTGLRSLLSVQSMLDTIGHNIANANTPGFSRQRVHLASLPPVPVRGILVGQGVSAISVQRSVDTLLNGRLLSHMSVSGSLDRQITGMSEIESLLSELEGQGIGDLLDAFYTSVSDLSTTPGDSALQSGVTQAIHALTSQFHTVASGIASLRDDAAAEIRLRTKDVNLLAKTVLELNRRILETESAGVAANDLRDQRDVALEELARLADIEAIEDTRGHVRVLVAGNMLVGSNKTYEMTMAFDSNGDPAVQIEGATGFVPVSGGSIGGLLSLASQTGPTVDADLDQLARNLILELNRVHSTGIPSTGSFEILVGASELQDLDKDGQITDELLSRAGLPFDVVSGSLYVNVVEYPAAPGDQSTGNVTKHQIEITQTHTTVGDFLDALNAIPRISAGLDGFGRVRIMADDGYGFDFSRRLDTMPDSVGSFGGGRASLGTAGAGPFALVDGDTLDLTAPAGGSSFSITFDGADFANIAVATAEEIAAVINADPNAQSAGVTASAVEGHLFVQTLATGATADFTVDGGTSLAALGLGAFAGVTISGHDNAVDAVIGGSYTGDANGVYTFQPNTDGTIGTTTGLMVDVYDANGKLVVSLDVGAGYTPGEELVVADGVTVSFGLGDLSATHGDLFALDVVSDPDSSDVLVALGLNSLLEGSGASDIALRKDIQLDPSLLASSGTGASGDNSALLDLLGTQDLASAGLGGRTFNGFYGEVASDFGFELGSAASALEANETLTASLEILRSQISGVNVDEEIVELMRYEQAFAAAAQFISVINELDDELLSIL